MTANEDTFACASCGRETVPYGPLRQNLHVDGLGFVCPQCCRRLAPGGFAAAAKVCQDYEDWCAQAKEKEE